MLARKKELPAGKLIKLVKSKITEFSNKISVGQKSTQQRFIREAIYGILQSGSSVLSKMAVALQPTGRTFHGVEKRLGYELQSNLRNNDLRDNANEILQRSAFLGSEPTFALDLTDINKEGSHVFEYMDKVHDGSEDSVVDGYMNVVIEGIQNKGEHLPLYLEMFSTKAKGFISTNAEVKKGVDMVVNIFGRIGHWVMDRGFDSSWIFQYFNTMKLSFIVRGCKNRNVQLEDNSIGLPTGQVGSLHEYIKKAELPGRYPFFHYYVLRKKGRKNQWVKKESSIKYGYCTVTLLPNHGHLTEALTLQVIIIDGIDSKGVRSYFFTNMQITKLSDALRIAKLYGRRWGCEEGIRFLKQALSIEDIRVQSYHAFQQMIILAHLSVIALWYCLRDLLRRQKRLYCWLIDFSFLRKKRPSYLYYKLLESIQKILLLDIFFPDDFSPGFLGKL
jgi:hypothetical protein